MEASDRLCLWCTRTVRRTMRPVIVNNQTATILLVVLAAENAAERRQVGGTYRFRRCASAKE